MERISVRRISPILHRERAGQAFPQEHGPAVGEPKQVGEHPKPGSIPLFWRDSKWKKKKAGKPFCSVRHFLRIYSHGVLP